MEYIVLSNGFSFPQVAMGTYPLVGGVLLDAIMAARQSGYGLIDTAIGYGNTKEIGQAVSSGLADNMLVSTKIDAYTLKKIILPKGLHRLASQKQLDCLIGRKTVERTIERHVDELGKVDIMLLHAPFRGCMKVYGKIAQLYQEKKIRAYGVSNFNIEELEQLYSLTGMYPMINQTEISPVNTQKKLISFCKKNNIVVEAYSPFGRGNLMKSFLQNDMLQAIAKEHGRSIPQIILRWVVQQGLCVAVRSSNQQRIKENISIFDFNLTDDEMDKIDTLDKGQVFGVNQISKKTVRL